MATLITDPQLEQELIAQRRAQGGDRFDEVWEGVYIMAPMANDEHQYLVKEFTMICGIAIDWAGLGQTRPGVNISDRRDDWKQNYRCPDVAVFLNGTRAESCGAFWHGGPDFAIEIASPGDKTLEKLPFYAHVETGELLVVEHEPWSLALFRLRDKAMIEVANSTPENSQVITSEVVPFDWQLVAEKASLAIQVKHHDRQQSWQIRIP